MKRDCGCFDRLVIGGGLWCDAGIVLKERPRKFWDFECFVRSSKVWSYSSLFKVLPNILDPPLTQNLDVLYDWTRNVSFKRPFHPFSS